MSVVWENTKRPRVVEIDFETERRKKRLEDSQQVDCFIWAAWLSGILLGCAWVRLCWIVVKAAWKAVMQ